MEVKTLLQGFFSWFCCCVSRHRECIGHYFSIYNAGPNVELSFSVLMFGKQVLCFYYFFCGLFICTDDCASGGLIITVITRKPHPLSSQFPL
uniref:Uncharacterized protein n=1 Tax=Rhizophora mucronata TaxID=61149 RepID=A0A2P2IXF0_RHIMU